ncbi:MAG: hypothetical protein IKN72_11395 [Clostridia bacterium]|nr:hypothetical protein [Clostridia bacterium]
MLILLRFLSENPCIHYKANLPVRQYKPARFWQKRSKGRLLCKALQSIPSSDRLNSMTEDKQIGLQSGQTAALKPDAFLSV